MRRRYERDHYRRQWRNLLLHFTLYLVSLGAFGLGLARLMHP